MFQFVIRRLLYSIVVLFAASVLVFTFVAKTGDPLAALALNPRISQRRFRTSRSESTSTSSIAVRYGYWVERRRDQRVRHDASSGTSRSCPTSGGS